MGANFDGVDFEKSHLERAILKHINFEGERLWQLVSIEPYFWKPILKELFLDTDLEGAKYLTSNQLFQVGTLYNTKLDERLRKELEDKDPDKYQALVKKPNLTLSD